MLLGGENESDYIPTLQQSTKFVKSVHLYLLPIGIQQITIIRGLASGAAHAYAWQISAGCWGHVSSSRRGPRYRAAGVSSQQGSWFLSEGVIQEKYLL